MGETPQEEILEEDNADVSNDAAETELSGDASENILQSKKEIAKMCIEKLRKNQKGFSMTKMFIGKGKALEKYLVSENKVDGVLDQAKGSFMDRFFTSVDSKSFVIDGVTYNSIFDYLKPIKEELDKAKTEVDLGSLRERVSPSADGQVAIVNQQNTAVPAIAAAGAGVGVGAVTETGNVAPEVVIDGHNYVYPLSAKAEFFSGFGWRIHPITKLPNKHRGIDLGLAEGSEILSMTDGKVVVNKKTTLGGNEIHIKGSDGREYCYLHLQEKSPLPVGTEIALGQKIAKVGKSGRANGFHLHLAVKKDGVFIDPVAQFPTIFDKDKIINAGDIPQIMANQQKQVTDSKQKQKA